MRRREEKAREGGREDNALNDIFVQIMGFSKSLDFEIYYYYYY